MSYALGIDLGGTRMKAVAITPAGELLDHKIEATAIERVPQLVDEMQRQRGGPAGWIGVAAPGIAAPDGKAIWWMQGRLDAVQGLNWAMTLGKSGVPVINDGQAALMGEIAVGAAKGCHNVVMITLGTGVGGAIVCDGRLLRGAIGRAGHLGHMTVDSSGPGDIVQTPGSLEDAIGNCTIVQRSGGKFATTYALLEAMQRGDVSAKEIWLISVRKLAAAVASIINLLDPELIVIGGGIAQAGDALFNPLRQHLDQMEWRPHGHRVKIVPATGGEFTGAIGAAWNAMKQDST